MSTSNAAMQVPSTYSRIIARELSLNERELPELLVGTGLPASVLLAAEDSHMTSEQQMRVLGNAQRMLGVPEFGLRLGQRLNPAAHGPMGYLVLSSPDVLTALESFAAFLPTRLPFSSVQIAVDENVLRCALTLKIAPDPEVQRTLQECFALMIQSVVESVSGQILENAVINLAHVQPQYYALYGDYLHSPVHFSQASSAVLIPIELGRLRNATGNSEAYAAAQKLCRGLLEQMPATGLPTSDRVRHLLLSAPSGSLTATDVARAMFVTKRTLQRRLEREGTSYREITEKLHAELAVRHLREPSLTIESIALLLGYFDTAAFRKAFRRWYGESPAEYRHRL